MKNETVKNVERNYPDYLYFCDVTNVEMMGVPLEKVEKILSKLNIE